MSLSEDIFLPRVLGSVIAILLTLSVFVALTAKNGAPVGIYDNGIGDHWPANHRTLTIVDRTGDTRWHQAIAIGVATWAAGGSALRFILTTDSGGCEHIQDTIEVCQASSDAIAHRGSEGEQGLFDPFVGHSHDYRSAIVLVCSDCNIDQTRRTVIATHELGHALGLAHSPDPNSVMFYLGGSPQPDAEDYRILRLLEGSAAARNG